MKYIIIEARISDERSQLIPVIFDKSLIHKDMATYVMRSMGLTMRCSCRVISAGQINIATHECWGESETLELKSRGELDTEVIRKVESSGYCYVDPESINPESLYNRDNRMEKLTVGALKEMMDTGAKRRSSSLDRILNAGKKKRR